MKIKIRQEKDCFLVYLLDARRIVGVNQAGAAILDMLFNRDMTAEEISQTTSQKWDIPIEQARQEIGDFLEQTNVEVDPNGFNVLEEEQLVAPLGAELEITTDCNLRCLHCYDEVHDVRHMPLEIANRIIGILDDNGVCEISLIGGEPFRYPWIMELLETCQNRDMTINLVSNATLITDEIIAKLATIKRLVMVISLDGTQEIHDYIRGKGVFQKADATIRKLIAANIACETIFTLNSVNASVYREFIEYCEGLGIPCNFSIFKPFREDHKDLIIDPDKFFEILIDLMNMRIKKKYKVGMASAAIVAELLGFPPRNECRATKSGLVINIDGHMVTCPSLETAGFYQPDQLPVFDENFTRTWQEHEVFENFRHSNLRECQARALLFSGDVNGYDPYGLTAFIKYWGTRKAEVQTI
ncbi:radical SAM protein [Patescibacteria group bacterium]|nr:radical SAM protein [Patescibacteria group bacterium]